MFLKHKLLELAVNPDILALGTGSFLGIPTVVLIAGVLALAVAFLVQRTTFGRQIVAIGGNRSASALSGLPVKRVLIGVYILCGVMAALAGNLRGASRPGDLFRPGAVGKVRAGDLVPGAEQHGVDAGALGEHRIDQAVGDLADLDHTPAGLLFTHERDFLYAMSIEP